MDLKDYLKTMVEKNASDLFFTAGSAVNIKIEGVTSPLNNVRMQPGKVQKLAYTILNPDQVLEFETTKEMNLAVSLEGVGRFRVNIYRQRGEVAMVVRYLKTRIPTIEELNLPNQLKEIVVAPRGLVLVVGATGSGKSTTLAAMIGYRASHVTGHILTIEDPIEYVYQHNKSMVDQREVGFDTRSYATALKNALRQSPDVILIGEVRDRATMEQAIAFAETGHLCLTTLHASNANQALERIANFFPDISARQLWMDLALNLNSIISQRLVRGIDHMRLPAVEILRNTPHIQDLIKRGEIDHIKSAMEKSTLSGMQTFDQALFNLYKAGKISKDEAIRHSDSQSNLSVQIRLEESGNTAVPDITLDEG